jgi:hypothetical protein
MGPEVFGFPEGLDYRTKEIKGLADVSGFSREITWLGAAVRNICSRQEALRRH